MDWQQGAALVVVGVTAVLMVGAWIRRLRKGPGRSCSASCRCPSLEFPASKPYLESLPNRPEKLP